MFNNRRMRVSALITAILVAVATGSLVPPANAFVLTDPLLARSCSVVSGNLVQNCGFESPLSGGVVPGWTHNVNEFSSVSSLFTHSGSKSLGFFSSGQSDVWTQTIPVAPHTRYLVGARFYSGHASAPAALDHIRFTATNVNGAPGIGATIFSSNNTDLNWVNGSEVVTTGAGRTVTLTFSGSNEPAGTFVDDVYVVAQQTVGCASIANNLVGNCGFEGGSPSPWINSGTNHDSQISVTSTNTGSQSLRLASTSADDSWFQVLAVRPHTQYTVSYWVEYSSDLEPVKNDLHVSLSNAVGNPGNVLKISTTNVSDRFWARTTRTFTTGTGHTAVLLITGANGPDSTYVDDVSVTAVSHVAVSAKGRSLTTSLAGVGGQKVELLRHSGSKWVVVRTWAAPKTGWSKSWTVNVSPASYRAIALAAPGYAQAASPVITVH